MSIKFFEDVKNIRESFIESVRASLKVEPIRFEKILPEKIEIPPLPTPPKTEETIGEKYPYPSKEQIEAGEMFITPRKYAEEKMPIEKILEKEDVEKAKKFFEIMAKGGKKIIEAFREYLRKREEEEKKKKELIEALPKEEKIKMALEKAEIPIIEKRFSPELGVEVL